MAYCIHNDKMIIDVSNYVVSNKFAYGGEITTDASGYIYHTFTNKNDPSSNTEFVDTLIILRDVDSSILLVGGGSAGNRSTVDIHFGGGGGGEVQEVDRFLPRGKYRITIGAGGAPVHDGEITGLSKFGTESKFDIYEDASGADSEPTAETVDGINSGSGNTGGTHYGTPPYTTTNKGAGGGGDSSIGQSIANGDIGRGDGGDGTRSSITGLYYGGGGAGSTNLVGDKPMGGLGGGGNGKYTDTIDSGYWAEDGDPHTGGGGGGGGIGDSGSGGGYSKVGVPPAFPAPTRGSHGGSGVVVVRIKY